MPFIGLTGNFGMGKTTALRLFKDLGAYTIDADELVSDLLKKPAIINKMATILGREILIKRSGRLLINKKHVADIIFDNPQRRMLVEEVIHPEVTKIVKDLKTKIISKEPEAIIVFEVPLLFESHYLRQGIPEKSFDKIIVVYCSKETAVRRLMAKGFSKEEVLKRMAAQMPISLKKASADFRINNNFDISRIRSQVKRIFKKLNP